MTATDTSRDETAECISEAHLLYIMEYIRYEEAAAKATLDRFLKERAAVRDLVPDSQQRGYSAILDGSRAILTRPLTLDSSPIATPSRLESHEIQAPCYGGAEYERG
jgi:hypothetical protein